MHQSTPGIHQMIHCINITFPTCAGEIKMDQAQSRSQTCSPVLWWMLGIDWAIWHGMSSNGLNWDSGTTIGMGKQDRLNHKTIGLNALTRYRDELMVLSWCCRICKPPGLDLCMTEVAFSFLRDFFIIAHKFHTFTMVKLPPYILRVFTHYKTSLCAGTICSESRHY